MRLIKAKSNNPKISYFLFNLRNKSYVKRNSINTKNLKFSQHKKWFDNFFKKKNILYIITKKKL